MKRSYILTLLSFTILCSGCDKGMNLGQPNTIGSHFLGKIWAVGGIYYYPDGNPNTQPVKANIENNEVKAQQFCLALLATDDTDFIPIQDEEIKEEGDFADLPYWGLEHIHITSNVQIEEALIACISEKIKKHFGYSISYQMDGIISVNITANVSLWNIEAGSSLNEHFYLFHTPVVSGETYALIDCNQYGTEWTVNRWTAHKPVGYVDSYFKFKTIPQELPLDVKFTIHVTSEKNKSFTATTKSVYITPE